MASDPNATALALRGPASVVGAGSRHGRHASKTNASHVSRSRRYNRSHAGGGSYVPRNEFPVFSNSGDVEIVVSVASGHENRYLLHKHTLTRCSGFFDASMSNEWSRARTLPEPSPPNLAGLIEGGTTGGGSGGDQLARMKGGRGDVSGSSSGDDGTGPTALGSARRRWRYELDSGTGDGDIPMLVQKEETPALSPAAGAGAQNTSIFGGPAPDPPASVSRTKSASAAANYSSHSHSHSFFRSVANLSFMPLSSSYAKHALPPPTQEEEDLLRDYDNLFRIMYNYPPVLDGINIADAYVQCKSLLSLADQYDALAVVGPRVDHHMLQFQSHLWKQVAKYPISYLRLGYLARSKVIFHEALIHVVGQWPAGERSLRAALPEPVLDLIEDKVDELEEAVSRVEARLFRLSLTTRSGERVSPATGFLDWLAVSLFRQWLADNTAPAPAVPSPQDRRAGGQPSSSRDANGHRHRSSGNGSHNNHNNSGGGGNNNNNNANLGVVSSGGGRSVQALAPPLAPPPMPPLASLGRTFRMVGAGGAGYLGHDECKRFLKLTPDLYSRDNLRRFEKRVDELKAMAREVVRPLTGSRLELLDPATGGTSRGLADGLGYLTCTNIGDRDLPWIYD